MSTKSFLKNPQEISRKFPKVFAVVLVILLTVLFGSGPIEISHAEGEVKLGGYGTSVGTGVGSNRDFIETTSTLSAGTISQVKVYVASPQSGATIRFKVWRLNGANLDFIGQSEAIDTGGLSTGLNTFNLVNTITSQDGDYLGVTLSGGTSMKVHVTTGLTGRQIYYADGDKTTNTPISSFTSNTTWALSMEFWGILAAAPLIVTSPVQYHTFQRDGSDQADIPISGTYTGTPTAIEASFNGESYSVIDASPSDGAFSGTLTGQNAGSGLLEVRFTNDVNTNDSVSDVGIGDVFVVIGDSIASGYATNYQTWSGSPGATMYKSGWVSLADPTGGGTMGSFWPLVATQFLSDQGVPIAWINVGVGGSTLHSDWLKVTGTKYTDMATAITASGVNKIKAFLVHLGANDSIAGTTPTVAAFKSDVESLVNDLTTDYPGSKVFWAQLGEVTTGSPPNRQSALDNIREAIREEWNSNSNLEAGPILYDIATDGGVHYSSDASTLIIGNRWWLALKESLFSGALGSGRGPTLTSATYDSTRTIITLNYNVPVAPILPATAIGGFVVYGNGSPATIDSAVVSDNTRIILTLNSAATLPITVYLGSNVGGTYTASAPNDSSTSHLPAEAFANITAIPVYSIGGTVSGLSGTLVLQNNADDDLSVTADSFTFATVLGEGEAYAVTVLTQPSGQTCTVSNGIGVVDSANVNNVVVSCSNNDTTAPVITSGSYRQNQGANKTPTFTSLDARVLGGQLSTGLTTPLYAGLTSPQVTQLQQMLALDSTIYPEAKITGYYGNLTKSAVARFQQKYGIVTTPQTLGVAGPATRAKLNEVYITIPQLQEQIVELRKQLAEWLNK